MPSFDTNKGEKNIENFISPKSKKQKTNSRDKTQIKWQK